jgi:hypothetical protein
LVVVVLVVEPEIILRLVLVVAVEGTLSILQPILLD